MLIWTFITLCFVAGLWLANGFITPPLTIRQLALIAAVCVTLAFIPVVGDLLCIAAGSFLIYRMSDESIGNSLLILLIARGLAVLFVLGVASKMR